MNTLTILSVIVGVIAFTAVWLNNTSGATQIVFTPPYHYAVAGDLLSELNAFFFAFVFSLLFFGLSAPITLAIEGAKYAGLLSTGAASITSLAFALPQVMAVFSATLLGQAIIQDYTEKRSLLEGWTPARNYFLLALAMLAIIFAIRALLPPLATPS